MKGLSRAVAVLSFSLLLGTVIALPGESLADADKDYKAALKKCKKSAEPKERDECVSNAKNRYGRGNKEEKATSGAEQKETKGKDKAKGEAKGESEKQGKESKGKSAKVKAEDGDGN